MITEIDDILKEAEQERNRQRHDFIAQRTITAKFLEFQKFGERFK